MTSESFVIFLQIVVTCKNLIQEIKCEKLKSSKIQVKHDTVGDFVNKQINNL